MLVFNDTIYISISNLCKTFIAKNKIWLHKMLSRYYVVVKYEEYK